MQKKKTISLLLILFVTIYWLRSVRILSLSQGLQEESKVRLRLRLLNKPEFNGSKYVLQYYNFRIDFDGKSDLQIGDNIEVIGTLSERVTGVVFPRYTVIHPTIYVISEKMSFFDLLKVYPKVWTNKIVGVRGYLLQKIEVSLPEPQASLLAGILLGIKSSLPARFYEALISSGTVHIVVASGFNLSVVAGMVVGLGEKKLNKGLRTLLSLGAVWFYAWLAGFEAPIVRAAIMVSFVFGAKILGRDYLPDWALLCSGAVMLLAEPLLIESVSFWLSFAATGGILWLACDLDGMLERAMGRRLKGKDKDGKLLPEGVLGVLSTTLAAQIATLPIVVLVFERVSVVAPLANLMILWLIPPIMVLGGILLLISLVLPTLGPVIAGVVWLPLTLVVKVVEFLGSWKWASLKVGVASVAGLNKFSALIILGYYVILWKLMQKAKMKRKVRL